MRSASAVVAAVEYAFRGFVWMCARPVMCGSSRAERFIVAISTARVGRGVVGCVDWRDFAWAQDCSRRAMCWGFCSSPRAMAWFEVWSTKGPRVAATGCCQYVRWEETSVILPSASRLSRST